MHIQNEEYVRTLQNMMGDGLDADVARRVLAKHNNDIHAAASAILEGDRGNDVSTVASGWDDDDDPFNSSAAGASGALKVPRRPNTPLTTPERGQAPSGRDVIDLTADNDPDLSRALQMSLEQSQSQTPDEGVFRRSDRAPDPNWAMVPSNVQMNVNSAQEQEDQSLSRAIEASLSTSYIEDRYEDLPMEEKIRKPGHPVAVRTSSNEHYFIPLVIQALFHVPQVREWLAEWRWQGSEKGLQPDPEDPEFFPYEMSGLFTYMDHVIVSYIIIDGLRIVSEYRGRLATTAADLPGELSNELYSYITRGLENPLRADDSENWNRLFHLRYAPIDAPLPAGSSSSTESNALGIENCPPAYSRLKTGSDTACVRVDLRGGTDGPNDLLSCLANQLGLEPSVTTDSATSSTNVAALPSQAQVLVSPSEVIAFELVRPSHSPSSFTSSSQQNSSVSSPIATPFRYPIYVYLDQFLLENATLAGEKRAKKMEMENRLKELTAKRENLTHFEGKDTLKSLTSALYYFENVATKDDSEARAQEVTLAATSLGKIIDKVNTEVQLLDTQISKLRIDIEKVFDDPELHKHRYDLRAVLVHDGLFGRSHIHSFVQHGGRWWKCQDAIVIEVSEEVVLTDTTGLHLGAGPYMLVYSRETEEVDLKSCWATVFKNNVKTENLDYLQTLEQVAPEAAASLRETYNPSPLLLPVSFQDEEAEEVGDDAQMSRRSMSAMSIVDEGTGGDGKERMDIA